MEAAKSNTGVVTTVVIIGVVGIGGYLLYKAGKSAAAKSAADSAVFPGTTLPSNTYHAPTTKPATNTAGGAAATASAGIGLIKSIIGLFGGSKKTKNTTASTGGTIGQVFPNNTGGGTGSAGGGLGSLPTNNGGTIQNNNWDGAGGYVEIFQDGSADYYYSDGTYAWSDDIGTWQWEADVNVDPSIGSNGGTIFENNWDGAGGYLEVYSDGSADYFDIDGNYYSTDPVGTWE